MTTDDPQAFVRQMKSVWDEGSAILPIDHRLPKSAVESLISRFKPHEIRSGDDRLVADGPPIAPGTALVVPTSGTTSRPKGVQLTHANLAASAMASADGLGGHHRWICCLPLSHIAGLSTVSRSWAAGLEPVVIDRFDPDAMRSVPDGCAVSMVPTMLHRMIEQRADLGRFDVILVGGGPVPEELVDRARELGAAVVCSYGMTESAGGCVYDGLALRDVVVRLDTDEQILLAGPVIFSSYRGDDALTTSSFIDGNYATGDLGRIEEGVLRVLGRIDDVIISGGEKVPPVVVEAALSRLGWFEDVAVMGAEDPVWGSRVVALVVGPSVPLSVDAIRDAVAEYIPRYMAPTQVDQVDEIPRNASGKILRAQLGTHLRA